VLAFPHDGILRVRSRTQKANEKAGISVVTHSGPVPEAELSYASGIARSFELVLAPLFVLFGGALSLLFAQTRSGQSTPPLDIRFMPVLFLIAGLIGCYYLYFKRAYRLELDDQTLYWFLPFHRLKGEASITDIASI
jgi:hypothetical protein